MQDSGNTRRLGFLLVFMLIGSFAFATSGIAIQSDNNSSIQVYINGKLYNRLPGKFVRVKSQPGLFHLEVRVVNPYDNKLHIIRKDIRVSRGYEFLYKVSYRPGGLPDLIEVKRYPVYSQYYLNYALYNRHPTS